MTTELQIPPERELPPNAERARRAHLVRYVQAEFQLSGLPSGGGHRVSHSRRWRVALVGVAAVLALALALPAILPGGNGGGAQPASAAEVLNEAAKAAALQPAPSLAPGQYIFRETQSLRRYYGSGPWYVYVPTSRRTWVAADGSGREIESYGDWIFPSAESRQAWIDAGRPNLAATGTDDCTYEAGRMVINDLSGLPTAVPALTQMIESKAINERYMSDYPQAKRSAIMLEEIGNMLGTGYGPGDVRAALYRVAASLPGVELLGQVKDPLGRSGTGVGVTWLGMRQELILEPATGGLLAIREVQVDPPVDTASPSPGVGVNADGVDDPGTVLGWGAYQDVRVVDSMPTSNGVCH